MKKTKLQLIFYIQVAVKKVVFLSYTYNKNLNDIYYIKLML